VKRADLNEHEVAMLRARCLFLGQWFALRDDGRGGVVIRIARTTFAELHRAAAHVDQLEQLAKSAGGTP
jgi:hypothetical protein